MSFKEKFYGGCRTYDGCGMKTYHFGSAELKRDMSSEMRFPTMWYVR